MAQLRPLVTPHRQQIDQLAHGAFTARPGFSGTPVLDAVTEHVLGLLVATAVRRDSTDIYAIPLPSVVSSWPAVFAPVLPSPYKGLHAFESMDRDLFFGRAGVVQELADAVATRGLVPVVGASGVGKSSVVHAGLVPHLEGQRPAWGFVTIRPRPTLLMALAAGLARLSGSNVPVPVAELEAWQDRLSRLGLAGAAELACAASGNERLLVTVDQFEEVLTQDCDLLLQQFAELTDEGMVTAVLPLREDSFGTFFVRHVSFGERLRQNAVALRGMDASELDDVVRGPALLRSVRITDGLVDELVGTVHDRPGALPLLEFSLDQMWRTLGPGQQTLSFDAYEEIGRLDGALAAHADRVLDGLNETEQAAARRLFVSHLTSPARPDVRQVLRRSECVPGDWQIIVRLANERLLTIGRDDDGNETAEVVHEALLRAWGRLLSWLDAERPFRSWRQLLRYAMTQWREAGESAALLTGALLTDSERWLDERTEDLGLDERRFIEMSLARAALEDSFTHISATLDVEQMTTDLVKVLIPHFCNFGELLILESQVYGDEFSGREQDGQDRSQHVFRRVALAHDDAHQAWDTVFPAGEILSYPPGSIYVQCIDSGMPVREVSLTKERADHLAEAWRRRPVARLLAGASMLLLPLTDASPPLGFFVCTRKPGNRPFDSYDTEIGMKFASRAAIFIDNARRYSRERATALTLQRSLLPTVLSAPSSVEVAHGYLPANELIEVGGDWYDSIALPGARVALVIGDVAGRGVRAAVTMGRLRAAIHALAGFDLSPAESLHQLDEFMRSIGGSEPHFATCAYTVFDTVTGTFEVASAGHLPPLLIRPDGTSAYLEVPPAPPLGIDEGPIDNQEFTIDDGSLLVLYTDGLIENPTRDLNEGMARLQKIFGPDSHSRPLPDLIRATLDSVYADQQHDDIAVLIARLRRLPADRHITWTLECKLTSVREARALVRALLKKWQLTELTDTTELLVSELVTNAIRFSRGEIRVRLVLERTLVCEVFDSSGALPRLRYCDDSDEYGRGLYVVTQLAHSWGSRRTTSGKVVWCAQATPTD